MTKDGRMIILNHFRLQESSFFRISQVLSVGPSVQATWRWLDIRWFIGKMVGAPWDGTLNQPPFSLWMILYVWSWTIATTTNHSTVLLFFVLQNEWRFTQLQGWWCVYKLLVVRYYERGSKTEEMLNQWVIWYIRRSLHEDAKSPLQAAHHWRGKVTCQHGDDGRYWMILALLCFDFPLKISGSIVNWQEKRGSDINWGSVELDTLRFGSLQLGSKVKHIGQSVDCKWEIVNWGPYWHKMAKAYPDITYASIFTQWWHPAFVTQERNFATTGHLA